MDRQWMVRRTNPDFINYLSGATAISPAFAQILVNRGLKSPPAVKCFLATSPETMSDPFLIGGMREALDLLLRAVKDRTRIFVHGDYDADGTTATALAVHALRKCGLSVDYFVPDRFAHGYGFHVPAVHMAKRLGAGIILTVDCGISSFEAVEEANKQGIEVIITDHHEPVLSAPEVAADLPRAAAIINPKTSTAPEEVACLSGAGVALKLAQALALTFPGSLDYTSYLDIAALGTIADSVPLVGENRAIVKGGIPRIQEGLRAGVRALREAASIDPRHINAGRIAFTLVPRLNAAGRMADANQVVELLLSEDAEQATAIAARLNKFNLERQQIEECVFVEATAMVEAQGGTESLSPVLVLASPGWHEGVLGIVATKLTERFGRPSIVLSVRNGEAKGSARSVPGFDIYGGLNECKGLLKAFGGHKQAAGLTLKAEDLGAFTSAISAAAARAREDTHRVLNIDADLSLRDLNFKLVEELALLEPYGYGNPEPVLGSRDLEVINPRIVGKNHLKMTLRSKSTSIDAIGFNMGDMIETVQSTIAVDAAYSVTVNEWEDRRSLQLKLKALRKA